MAEKVLMPKQGNTVESCIILEWKKQEGDPVEEGEVICEAETDKATIEVESTAGGTVLKLLYGVDDEVPVQQPIAVVGEPEEDISSLLQDMGGAVSETAEESDNQNGKQAGTHEAQKTACGNTSADTGPLSGRLQTFRFHSILCGRSCRLPRGKRLPYILLDDASMRS